MPQKLKQEVVDDILSILYVSSKDKMLEFASQFTGRWQKEIPLAVKCPENSLGRCLTFFAFPEEEWISLRTTNVIERLNKEFKRRTRPMEIVAGENACYTLLVFISIKMEICWRSDPVGKVHYNLPSLRRLIQRNLNYISYIRISRIRICLPVHMARLFRLRL
jgi:putative transposase